jgi:16S rRNA (guanine966-N2)-methyltransferase
VRVIAGEFKGRKLAAPRWEGLRPTSDKLRETLFNVLAPVVGGARVLDGYAGTGALGIEALSRGASRVAFIDTDPRAVALIRENIAQLGPDAESRCAVTRGDLGRDSGGGALIGPFDLILLDPPYDLGRLEEALGAASALLARDGRVVLEHAKRRTPPERAAELVRYRTIASGDSALSFFRLDRAG